VAVTITPLSAVDRDDWQRLWVGYLTFYGATLTDDVTEATFRRLVDGRELRGAIARDEDGHALGIVHWLSHPATWSIAPYTYLEDLFVAPESRGSGTGRALIEHVVAWARDAGHVKVYWLTKADNRAARTLYDRVATDTGFVHYQVATV